eukprot:3840641-Amphidinium_carterae.1
MEGTMVVGLRPGWFPMHRGHGNGQKHTHTHTHAHTHTHTRETQGRGHLMDCANRHLWLSSVRHMAMAEGTIPMCGISGNPVNLRKNETWPAALMESLQGVVLHLDAQDFQNLMVRLFSMLHAGSLADIEDSNRGRTDGVQASAKSQSCCLNSGGNIEGVDAVLLAKFAEAQGLWRATGNIGKPHLGQKAFAEMLPHGCPQFPPIAACWVASGKRVVWAQAYHFNLIDVQAIDVASLNAVRLSEAK